MVKCIINYNVLWVVRIKTEILHKLFNEKVENKVLGICT